MHNLLLSVLDHSVAKPILLLSSVNAESHVNKWVVTTCPSVCHTRVTRRAFHFETHT